MMQIRRRKKIVVLGMMGKSPVAGMVWLTMQYVAGLARLGFDVYYVEAHARTPSQFTTSAEDDGSIEASAFIDSVMRWFGLPDGHWAFQALHSDRRCYGLSDVRLAELYQSADLIINLHGGTRMLPEHIANGRLLFLETDPVEFAVYLAQDLQEMIDYIAPHAWFFTWGENYGKPDCQTPVSNRTEPALAQTHSNWVVAVTRDATLSGQNRGNEPRSRTLFGAHSAHSVAFATGSVTTLRPDGRSLGSVRTSHVAEDDFNRKTCRRVDLVTKDLSG